jgi:predicted Zn-dependent peptidase
MPDLETLAVSVVAGRGARAEREAQSGWAHLLEHMVFKGAGERSARDIVEVIEAAGGQINAATGYERTSFQVRALKGGLPLALSVLADLVLRPTLDAGELEREKSVIGQEIAEAADAPDDRVFDLAQSRAYAGQALGRPILGEVHTIATADPQSLSDFRAGQYAPGRLVVSAAGAVDEDELLALVERLFGAETAPQGAEPDPAAFAAGFIAESRGSARAIRPISPSVCSPRRLAGGCPRACSRRRASGSVWPMRSTPMAKAMPTPACWAFMPEQTPATPREPRRSWPRSCWP